MARYVDVEPIISNTIAMKSICTAIDIDGIVKRLEEAPTADVKEVIRGEWLNCFNKDKGFGKCSICCKEHYDYYSYCPNCGADMRGENNGDN